MVTFCITTGDIGIDGACVGSGYSGAPGHVDVAADIRLHALGPIPTGLWEIGDPFDDPGGKGPCVMPLAPAEGTETYGRGGFLIHGDNPARSPRSSSEGCIVTGPDVRRSIAESLAQDRRLTVST